MGNNTIKQNLFIYNTTDIIIKDSRYPYNVIYQNKYSNYNNHNYIYSYFDTIFIKNYKYQLYRNNLFNFNHIKCFIISKRDNSLTLNYISPLLSNSFKLDNLANNINSLYNLFDFESNENFATILEKNINNKKTKWKWNGVIKYHNRYEYFQIDSIITYHTYPINYSIITNISHLFSTFKKELTYLSYDYNYNIPKFIETTQYSNLKTIHLLDKLLLWFNKNNMLEYSIHYSVPEHIIIDEFILDSILDTITDWVYDIHISIINNHLHFLLYVSNNHNKQIKKLYHIINTHRHHSLIQYNNELILLKLLFNNDKLTDKRPIQIKTDFDRKENNIKIYIIDKNINNKLIYDLKKNGYQVYSTMNIYDMKKHILQNIEHNNIIIYKLETNYIIHTLRLEGILLPIIIDKESIYNDRYYNYVVDYPFTYQNIKESIIDIATRANILVLDREIKDSLLLKNILEKKLNYNVFLSQDLLEIPNFIKHINIDLIIIDHNIIDYFKNEINYLEFKKIKIPIVLIIEVYDSKYHFFKNMIYKPYSIDILHNKIISLL